MPKKLKLYEEDGLADIYETVLGIKSRIEDTLDQIGKSIEECPPSAINTQLLYNILAGYEIMYNNLYDAHLVRDKFRVQNNTIH